MTVLWRIAAVLLLLLAGTLTCATQRQAQPLRVAELREVVRHWEAHERVLRRIVEGGRIDESYESAVEFFEDTTGIPASDRQTYVGRLPSQTLADDLRKWRGWFRENEGSLYWDPESSRIRVRGAKDETPPEGLELTPMPKRFYE